MPEKFLASWLATLRPCHRDAQPVRFVARFQADELEHVQAETFIAPLTGEGAKPWGLLVSVAYLPVVV
ncbi:MAG: hypothetical protein WDM89_20430 [Rhizomicrobium sp.]